MLDPMLKLKKKNKTKIIQTIKRDEEKFDRQPESNNDSNYVNIV